MKWYAGIALKRPELIHGTISAEKIVVNSITQRTSI